MSGFGTALGAMALNRPSTSPLRSAKQKPNPDYQRDRSSDCTHIKMTRLYLDELSHQKCSMCGVVPSTYMYRCTQDFNGFLPASDFNEIETTRRLEHDAQLYTLSPSVTEAAAKGYYTKEELAILWKQKTNVRKLIQQIRPTTSSSESTASTTSHSITASASYSTFPSSESDTDLDREVFYRTDCFPMYRGFLETIHEVHDDLEKDVPVIPFAKATVPAICNFKVCSRCHPRMHRDKAWASIDGVLETPYRQLAPPSHEFHNKRLSDVNIVKTLGLSTTTVKCHDDVQDVPFLPTKRRSKGEFQDVVQCLLRGQEPDCVIYPPNNVAGSAQSQGLSRQIRCTNLAAMEARSFSQFDTLSRPSITDFVSFDNNDTTLSTTEISGFPDDDKSSMSSFEPTPIFHRRGFERMTSIQVPPRTAVSHCGESSSSRDPPTSQSTLSCPGVMERELAQQEINKGRFYAQYNARESVKSQSASEPVIDGASDQLQPPKTPIESSSGSGLGFKWTPQANPRFFID